MPRAPRGRWNAKAGDPMRTANRPALAGTDAEGFADLSCFPGSFEQLAFCKAHENWIQSAGFQACVPADVVSVFPVLRCLQKSIQNLEGL